MKTAYSTFRSDAWKAFKDNALKNEFPNKDEYGFSKYLEALWNITPEGFQKYSDECFGSRDTSYALAFMSFLWKFRQIQHYFLAPGLAHFCEHAVKELSPDYCKSMPEFPPVQSDSRDFFATITPGKMQSGFAIHFPAKENDRSIIVIPSFRVRKDDVSAYGYFAVCTNGDDISLLKQDNRGFLEDSTSTGFTMNKIVFGLSLYMDAYPEMVVDAGQANIHEIKHYHGSRNEIHSNDVVREEARCSMSPHWRRGFFRLLLSEKFVHKKGQSVYVKGSFVKGKANDVLFEKDLVSA